MACVHELDRRIAPYYHPFRCNISKLVNDRATCPECGLLLQVIEEVEPGWLSRDTDALREIGFNYPSIQLFETPIDVFIRTPSSSGSWSTQQSDSRSQSPASTCRQVAAFEYYRLPTRDHLFTALNQDELHEQYDYGRKLGESLDIISNTSYPEAIERMSEWLSCCVDNDTQCRTPDESFMPRRLISTGTCENDNLVLFEPIQSPDTVFPYVCLSYCWGPDTVDVFKTTKSNLAAHCNSIDISHLPRTLQDAIYVCRGINVPFLWVDSLCIVQDDNADWVDQASRMKKIYANSHLTICAMEPSSCQDGFLGEQKFGQRAWQRRVTLDVPVAAGGPGNAILIRMGSHSAPITSAEKRAWCFQEFMLPTRTLSFNGQEMQWDCNCRRIDESGHFSREKHKKELRGLRDDYFDDFLIGFEDGPGISASTLQEWGAIVKAFSSRAITNPNDRLPALHGLSEMMAARLEAAEANPGEFLAGLWRNQFVRGLTWRVQPSAKQIIGPRFYIAPSWSWAYSGLPVEYNFLDTFENRKKRSRYKEDCQIEEIFCRGIFEWESHDTVPVHNAYATLRGQLQSVLLIHTEIEATENSDEGEGENSEYKLFMDSPEPVKIEKARPAHVASPAKCADGTAAGLPPGEVFQCFRLFTRCTNVRGMGIYRGRVPQVSAQHAEVWFLILRRVPEADNVVHERIGIGVYADTLGAFDLFKDSSEECVTII